MRRVVVTGLGRVTPLASGVEETWDRLLDGQSGAGPITRFDAKDVVTKYACEISFGDGSDGTFNPDDWMEPKEQRKVDDFIIYGMAAAVQAVRDAGWEAPSEDERLRTGVMIGSGIGGGMCHSASTVALPLAAAAKPWCCTAMCRSSSSSTQSPQGVGRPRSSLVASATTVALSSTATRWSALSCVMSICSVLPIISSSISSAYIDDRHWLQCGR